MKRLSLNYSTMNFKVTKIGEVTTNGNRIISLKSEEEIVVKTALGSKRSKPFYLIGLKEEDITAKEGDVVDLDLSLFNRVQRVSDIVDDRGNPATFTWLHLR